MRTIRPIADRSARRRRARGRGASAATLAVLAGLAPLVAGCGGASPSGGVAHLGKSTSSSAAAGSGASSAQAGGAGAATAQLASKGVAYANCMRAHGVANYPDPKISVHGNGVSVAVAARPGPHFKPAQQACRKLLPAGPPGSSGSAPLSSSEQAQVLKFAACVRVHGVPNLPDPTFSGGGVHLPESVDTHSAVFKSAEQACQSLIPTRLRGGEH